MIDEPNPAIQTARLALRRGAAHLLAASSCQQNGYNLLTLMEPIPMSAGQENRDTLAAIKAGLAQLREAQTALKTYQTRRNGHG